MIKGSPLGLPPLEGALIHTSPLLLDIMNHVNLVTNFSLELVGTLRVEIVHWDHGRVSCVTQSEPPLPLESSGQILWNGFTLCKGCGPL